MSLRNFLMMIVMVVIFPAAIICYNVDAFFITLGLVLMLFAIGGINSLLTYEQEPEEMDEDDHEAMQEGISEIGDVLGINAHRLGYGFAIALDCLFILFFIFVFFWINNIFLRTTAILLAADWAYDIIRIVDSMLENGNPSGDSEASAAAEELPVWKDRLYELYLWLHNIAAIIFVAGVFLVKYVF